MRTAENSGKIDRERKAGIAFCLALLASLAAVPACSQASIGSSGTSLPTSNSTPANMESRRELVDPCLGTRWQWRLNGAHPAWPARLVKVSAAADPPAGQVAVRDARTAVPGAPKAIPEAQAPILAGDRVELEQETAVVSARLYGQALEFAAVGQSFQVRMRPGSPGKSGFTGPVVTAIALGNGRARWVAGKVAR